MANMSELWYIIELDLVFFGNVLDNIHMNIFYFINSVFIVLNCNPVRTRGGGGLKE